ncbi:UNVERIFIED_CONTAM: spore germination protein KC [Brevibacillus sp. OAP136]
MKIFKCKVIILCITMLSVLTGCWDYTEYENMALARTIGIDLDKQGQILVTVETIRTSKKGNKGNKAGTLLHGSGKTVPEAIANLQTSLQAELFLGYTIAIILSEEAAKKHMKNIMDYLFITPDIRDSVYIVMSKERPGDILGMPTGATDQLVGEAIQDFFMVTVRTGVSFPVRLKEFNKMLLREGLEAVAPLIKKADDRRIELSGMVVFKGYSPTGVLDVMECKGWGRIANKSILGRLSLPVMLPGAKAPVFAAFKLEGNKSKIKLNTGGIIPQLNISTQVTATVDQIAGNSGLITPEILDAYEKALQVEIKKELTAVMKKAQRLKSDFFGIGPKFYQQHRREWNIEYKKKWNEVFSQIPVHYDVKVKILNSGVMVFPFREQ